jgi:hypothetical protein
MKKLVSAVLAVVFLSASAAFARPEINVKAGIDVSNTFSEEIKSGRNSINSSVTPQSGFSIGGEILFPILNILRVGGGLDYLSPRKLVKGNSETEAFLLPIYATIQVNPIKVASGVFIKGNIGLALWGFVNEATVWTQRPDSGLYLAIGGGYEFPFGLILGLEYKYFMASTDKTVFGQKYEYSYSAGIFGLNVGYKFKL